MTVVQNVNRKTNWPDRGVAPTPLIVGMVPYPPLFAPFTTVGGVVIAPVETLLGNVGVDRNSRLNTFWNSARNCMLNRRSLPMGKFRAKLIDSAGCRCQR